MNGLTVSFTLKNRIDETNRLGRRVKAFGQRLGLSARQVNAINLALEEVFINIVSYGFPQGGEHRIRIALTWEDGTVSLRITDDGMAFNPLDAAPPDLACQIENTPIGGLGIHLARHMVDHMHYERRNHRNRLILSMQIHSDREKIHGNTPDPKRGG
jgi:serine/threonine-protein kinase RsbW